MAELIAAVHVKDPERPGAKPVLFLPGDDVPERFWPYMSNPAVWKDGVLPSEPQEADGPGKDSSPSDPSAPPSVSGDKEAPKAADTKPAAPKAATKPASRRRAAAEGTGGH
ncbi:hypothetical protein OG552_10430 [Streptomyces sp. NBC_01476]|uniref:hypothetical protein n=1 Tax=Streptomyces sp. NBC_01476 TaxID=2903881 RepID=UPI002E3349DC|nr:hypothetical protein [Streptomyces sp. NBC_01476]